MDYFEISNRIKELRIQKFGEGYGAPKKFADFLGIKYTTYLNHEKGKPALDVVVALAHKMNVSVDWLITGRVPEFIKIEDAEEREIVQKLLKVLRTKTNKTKKLAKDTIESWLETPDEQLKKIANGE